MTGLSVQGYCKHRNPFFLEQSTKQYFSKLRLLAIPEFSWQPKAALIFRQKPLSVPNTQMQSKSKNCEAAVFLGVPDLVSDG